MAQEKIRTTAYRLWEQHGRPEGRDQEFWYMAEAVVCAEAAVSGSPAPADPRPSPRASKDTKPAAKPQAKSTAGKPAASPAKVAASKPATKAKSTTKS